MGDCDRFTETQEPDDVWGALDAPKPSSLPLNVSSFQASPSAQRSPKKKSAFRQRAEDSPPEAIDAAKRSRRDVAAPKTSADAVPPKPSGSQEPSKLTKNQKKKLKKKQKSATAASTSTEKVEEEDEEEALIRAAMAAMADSDEEEHSAEASKSAATTTETSNYVTAQASTTEYGVWRPVGYKRADEAKDVITLNDDDEEDIEKSSATTETKEIVSEAIKNLGEIQINQILNEDLFGEDLIRDLQELESMPEGTVLSTSGGPSTSNETPKQDSNEPQSISTENQGTEPESMDTTPSGQNPESSTETFDAKTKRTIQRMLDGHFFIVDTHVHVLKYHGNLYRNAKPYKEWAKHFGKRTLVPNTETPPLAGMIDIMHNPRYWFPDNLNPTPNNVRFEVQSGLDFTMPDGKVVGLTLACHPLMAGQDNDGDKPLYTPLAVKTALFQILAQSRTLFGKAIVGIGETGFDWGRQGTPKNEKPPNAQRLMVIAHLEAAKEFCLPLIFHVRGEDLERVKMLHRELFLLLDTHKYPTGDFEKDKEQRDRLGEWYDARAWPIILHTFCADQDILAMWTAVYPNTYAAYSKGSMAWPEAKKCLTEYDLNLDNTILETDSPMFDQECNEPNVPRDSDRRNPAHPKQILDLLQIVQLSRGSMEPEEVVRRLARNSMAAFRLTNDQIRAGLLADTENPAPRRDYRTPFVPKQASAARQAAAAAPATGPPKQQFSQQPALKPDNQPPKPKVPRENATRRAPILTLQRHDPGMHVAAITMTQPSLDHIKLKQARELLLLRIDNRSNLGLCWNQACLLIHTKGTPCSGRRIGGSLYSFDEQTIPSKIPPKFQNKAYILSRTLVPSLLQHVLLHWAGRVDDNDARKYELLRQLVWVPKPENRPATPPEALDTMERFCTQLENERENLPKLGAIMVREAARSFVGGCLVTKTAVSRVKNVGPIQISTETNSLSPFQKAVVDFINLQLPEAIDSERSIFMDKQVGRHAKASDQTRTLYACTQVLYLGDSIAAALAHRNKVSASYLELYTFKDLQVAFNHIYLNRKVETVFVSVGRTDVNDYYAHEGRSTYRLQMENFTETLSNNFPHVRVVWIHPTILVGSDPDHELHNLVWDEHVNENSVDTFYDDTSAEPENERVVECQPPKLMGDALDEPEFKGLSALEEIEVFQDHCGNLKPKGVQMITKFFTNVYGLDYWHMDEETQATPVEELRVPAFHQWKVKAPAGQSKPPVGGRLNLVPFRRVPSPMEISVYPSEYRTETQATKRPLMATATGYTESVVAPKPAGRLQKPAKSLRQQTSNLPPKPIPVHPIPHGTGQSRPTSGASAASYSTAGSSRRSSAGYQDDFGSFRFFEGPNTAYVQSRTAGSRWAQNSPKPSGSGTGSLQPSQTPTPTPTVASNVPPKPQLQSTAPAASVPPTTPWTFGQGTVPPGFHIPAQPGPMVPGWYPYPSPYGAPMPGMPYYNMQPQNMPQHMGMAPMAQSVGQQPQGGTNPQAAPVAPIAPPAANLPQPPVNPGQQPPPQPFNAAQMAALMQDPNFMQMAMGFLNQQRPPTTQ